MVWIFLVELTEFQLANKFSAFAEIKVSSHSQKFVSESNPDSFYNFLSYVFQIKF
jgi:hypothetical protein